MPRYFFDVHNGSTTRDDEGTECADLAAMRQEVLRLLPDIARDEVPEDGDRRTFTVLVSDEDGKAVFTATLTFTALWLLR